MLGRALDDAKLVSYSYAYEQATHHRRAPLRTPALGKLAPLTWHSRVQAPGGALAAKFTLDPATSELAYEVTANGFAEGDILAASIHRLTKEPNGPAIAILANHAFTKIAGTETLSDPDREKLLSGGLYLRLATRSKSTDNLRLPLKPTGGK